MTRHCPRLAGPHFHQGSILLAVALGACSTHRLELPKVRAADGTDDNPAARVQFEWMQLRDALAGIVPPEAEADRLRACSRGPARHGAGEYGKPGTLAGKKSAAHEAA